MESAGSGRSLFSMLMLRKKLSGASIGLGRRMRGQEMRKVKRGSVSFGCFLSPLPGNRTRAP